MQELQPVPVTRQRGRQAARLALPDRIRTEAGLILRQRSLPHDGHQLDLRRLGRTNFIVMVAAINSEANQLVGRGTGERHEFSQVELDRIDADFGGIVARAVTGVFDG